MCSHSNETRASIANLPNSAQLDDHAPKLYPGPCSSVGMRHRTDRYTDTQTAVTNIHFASPMPHAKCNQQLYSIFGGSYGSALTQIIKLYVFFQRVQQETQL